MNFAKWFIYIGLGFIVVGGIFYLLTKMGLPLGKFPGDIRIKGEKTEIYFPIVTFFFISVFLTLLINLFLWIFRK